MGPQRAQAGQMAALLAMFANVHRDPKRPRTFKAADFNPYHERGPGRKPRQVEPDDLAPLRKAMQKGLGTH